MWIDRFSFTRTLHGRFLLALVLIGIIPVGLIGLGISYFQGGTISEQSARELVGLARGLAGQLDVHLNALVEDARAMSALPEITSMDRERQNALLKELFHHHSTFARLSVFDRRGRRIASSHPGGAPSIAVRKSFQTVVGRGRQSWEVAHALTTGRSSLLIHTPIRDAERQVVGVLGAVVDLEDISAAVNRVHVGGGGQAFVVDAAGRILLHREKAAIQERLDYSWIGLPTGGRLAGPGTIRYDAAGEFRIAGYALIPNTGWTVVVERPEADILIPAKRSFRLALTGLGISVTLALVAAAFFALKLTRPVRELTQAARAFAAGDPSVPVPSIAAKDSEIAVLVETFDAMRKAVETRERALRGSLERSRVLRDIDAAITSTLDLRAVLDVLLEKLDLILPYDAATIRLFNKETGLLEPVACRNLDEKEWKAARWRGEPGLANATFEAEAPVIISDARIDPLVRDKEFYRKHELVSSLGLPLIAKGEKLGVLNFYMKEKHDFSSDQLEFLSTLAGQASIAIHNSQLYERAKQQAAELAQANEDLEKSNKAKDEFLSVMSHELRTPLNVVVGYTEMMRERMLGEINQRQDDALHKITDRSQDLLDMITGILQATSIQAGAIKVETREVKLNDFLDDLRLFYHIPSNENITLIWDYPSELPLVHIDSDNLKHILQNLINNAIKFTEKGTVTVAVRHVPEENAVRFKVSDTGIGIPQEKIPIIFEMFRQVDSSETRPFGGVGIGLYIAKQFTEQLGGRIEVESEPGKGSTFTVTVPERLNVNLRRDARKETDSFS